MHGGIQITDVFLCGALALLTHKHWQQFITRLAGELKQQGLFHFLLRATTELLYR